MIDPNYVIEMQNKSFDSCEVVNITSPYHGDSIFDLRKYWIIDRWLNRIFHAQFIITHPVI